jgi:hypothetical protein
VFIFRTAFSHRTIPHVVLYYIYSKTLGYYPYVWMEGDKERVKEIRKKIIA